MSGVFAVGPQVPVGQVFQEDREVDEVRARLELLAIATLDGRLAHIASIQDPHKSKQAFVALTQSQIETDDLMKVVNAFHKIHRTSDECRAFVHMAATRLFQAGDLRSARDAAMKVVCGEVLRYVKQEPLNEEKEKNTLVRKQRNELLISIADAHYAKGEYDLAYDCIAAIPVRNQGKNRFLIKLGDVYLESGNFDKALEFYRQIDDKNFGREREERLGTLATCCITASHWKCAKIAIREIVHDEKAKASLLSLLVECCTASGNLDDAFGFLSQFLTFETDEFRLTIEALYCPIYEAYTRSGELVKAIKCLQTLMRLLVIREFSLNGTSKAFKINEEVDNVSLIQSFSAFLCQKLFSFIKALFAEGDSTHVISCLRDLVSKHATQEAFKTKYKLTETPSPERSGQAKPRKTYSLEEEKAAFILFELPFGASQRDIEERFKKLRFINHTDKIVRTKGESEDDYQKRVLEALDKFHKITAAYNVLCDEEKAKIIKGEPGVD